MTVDLNGRNIIITGANSGIGFEAAKALGRAGANIILAVRDTDKGREAARRLANETAGPKADVMRLDLADLSGVKRFAEDFAARYEKLDVLINNAGIMSPAYGKTRDGFELQFGINYLGHYALTGLLLPILNRTPGSRVVTVTSIAHRSGRIDFDNLDGAKGYRRFKFYAQSKLADLLFAKELDDRLRRHGMQIKSIACHPGIASTNLFKVGKRDSSAFLKYLMARVFQSGEMGALPTVYAATEQSLGGGELIGPNGRGNRKGHPAVEIPAPGVYNKETMARLWDVSEALTGVKFEWEQGKQDADRVF